MKKHAWKLDRELGTWYCRNCPLEVEEILDPNAETCPVEGRNAGEVRPHPADDTVNHPNHYTAGGIECIDAIEAVVGQMQGLDAFYTAQVLKYLWRWPLKGGVEDLKKARWYLERLIAKKESKP